MKPTREELREVALVVVIACAVLIVGVALGAPVGELL